MQPTDIFLEALHAGSNHEKAREMALALVNDELARLPDVHPRRQELRHQINDVFALSDEYRRKRDE